MTLPPRPAMEKIAERAAKATKGRLSMRPFHAGDELLGFIVEDFKAEYSIAEFNDGEGKAGRSKADAELFIHARTDIPDLLAYALALEEVLSKLPRTADGVPIVPGMRLYAPAADWEMRAGVSTQGVGGRTYNEAFPATSCYSTREAADAALAAASAKEGK